MSLSEEARRNREVWTKANAEYTDRSAAENWAQEEITFVSADWARRWPSEEIWVVRKRP